MLFLPNAILLRIQYSYEQLLVMKTANRKLLFVKEDIIRSVANLPDCAWLRGRFANLL